MKTIVFLNSIFLIFSSLTAFCQYKHDVFYVEFTDKNTSPYSLLRPHEFLSPKSLERRAVQHIELDESDLPLAPSYMQQVEAQGARILNRSKWFNAVSIYAPDSLMRENIKKLSCVRYMKPLGFVRNPQEVKWLKKIIKDSTFKPRPDYYGDGENTIKMLQGNWIHDFGYRGKDMHVAIFDGGFLNCNRMVAFDTLFANHRILGTRDFLEGDEFVYEASDHGTNVLSTIASNMPYLLVGTAPDASFYLFKTEDVKGEYWLEEFNWIAAAEHSDSLGVDVINSSLGYTVFHDTTMSYKQKDMNGKTAMISRGADIATDKGILVVNSAGNEGDGKWHCIGAPADAFNVVSVGAVRVSGKKANFSSFGPTADGRIKPNVMALGQDIPVASVMGFNTTKTNGTSFSGPVTAGMLTALWQAFPNKTNFEIKTAIEQAGHQYGKPDSAMGYGIPNYVNAYLSLLDSKSALFTNGEVYTSGDLSLGTFHIMLIAEKELNVTATLYDAKIQLPLEKIDKLYKAQTVNELKLNIPPNGIYIVKLEVNNKAYWIPVASQYQPTVSITEP